MKTILLSIILIFSIGLFAQQLPDYTIAKDNMFSYNPALAGSEEANVVYLTTRYEWTKMRKSPFSAFLAYHQPLKEHKNVGLGGYFFNDFTGPTSFTGVNFSFAYHLVFSEYRSGVSERKVLSFGLSASAVQYRINGNDIHLDIPQDESLYRYKGSQFFPDASFGVYYKSKKITASLSVPQLLHLNVPVNSRQAGEKATLRKMQHYFGLFSYKFQINQKLINDKEMYLEPIVNIHYVIGAPFQGVVALRYSLEEIFYIEAGYRSLSTMIFGAGFTIKDRLSINYAYDFNFNEVRANLGSVHELQLKFKFNELNF